MVAKPLSRENVPGDLYASYASVINGRRREASRNCASRSGPGDLRCLKAVIEPRQSTLNVFYILFIYSTCCV